MLVGMLRDDRSFRDLVLWLFTFLLMLSNSCGHSIQSEESTDVLLCRSCGADIADATYISHRFSPQALIQGNHSLFGKHSVSIQLLQNPIGIRFRVLIVEKALCIGVDGWKSEFSWYPGYAWKTCICAHCGHHLGWLFEPLVTAVEDRKVPSEKGFIALILDNVLTESFSDSLMIVPKSYKS